MDKDEHRALETFAGCPHCGGPVGLGRVLARERHDLLTRLALLIERRPLAEVRAVVRRMQAEAGEGLYADILAAR